MTAHGRQRGLDIDPHTNGTGRVANMSDAVWAGLKSDIEIVSRLEWDQPHVNYPRVDYQGITSGAVSRGTSMRD